MKNFRKAYFLNEAIRIGEDILSKKKVTEHGFSWETMKLGSHNSIAWDQSESIYSGVGGIVLFFIELYKQKPQEKFLNAAIKGVDWIMANNNHPTSNYSFFTGRIGLTYVLFQLSQITDNDSYINYAVQITDNSLSYLNKDNCKEDMLTGVAGSLLGLLYLHNKTRKDKLLVYIEAYTKFLIESAHPGAKGLYWTKSTDHIKGLCGFSHGAAGIGYVFLQLGSYFKNPAFYWIAKQAFSYENYFFNKKKKNWPDFRKGIAKNQDLIDHKSAFINNQMGFFNDPSYMTAWCHGAPGIGFSRLFGWKHLKSKIFKKDFENAIQCTKDITLNTPLNDVFVLCHGKAGNAMLFLEAYKELKDNEALRWARIVAKQMLRFKDSYGFYSSGYGWAAKDKEDLSLFMGNSGIGYFYLKCIKPYEIPNILSPKIKGCCKSSFIEHDFLNIGEKRLKKNIFSNFYPKTISFMEDSNFSPKGDDFFYANLNQSIKKKNGNYKYLEDLYNLEKKKMSIEADTNPAYQNIKFITCGKKARKMVLLHDKNLLNKKLIMSNNATIWQSKWVWPLENDVKNINLDNKPSQYYIFFKCPLETKVFNLSPFSYQLLEKFTKPQKLKRMMDQWLSSLDSDSKTNKNIIRKHISDQVKEFIRSLILVEFNN